MNLLALSFAYIRQRPLSTVLNLALLALGAATIAVLILFDRQLGQALTRDARGIDLVVGAKGSPLQLILSAVYHADVPTGNIPLSEAEALKKHRFVAAAIPLALGDAHKGFRIVGTEHAYPAHYRAQLAAGRLWQMPMEATLGATAARTLGLAVGAKFVGAHGVGGEGAAHAEDPYSVVGVLTATGTVLDRLILTSVESVWRIHDEHRPRTAAAEKDDDHDHDHEKAQAAGAQREITALLIRYRSPLAVASLPREVNAKGALQSASPALETARLLSLVGVGLDAMRGFALLLVAAAALGIFVALANALEERRYDLAIMRSLGASRATLLRQILLEGLLLAVAGTVLGWIGGHLAAEILAQTLPEARGIGLSGLVLVAEEAYLFTLALIVGVLAAAIPAVRAYRTDIAATLAER